jgi:cytochrome b561
MSGGQEYVSCLGEDMISNAMMIPAYTFTARVLHWITAFLVLAMIPLGVVIANEWGGSAQNALYDLHRSIGVTIIPLVILRIIYRWLHPPLPLPADIAPMQRFAAHATHWGLYMLLIAQPFTGWTATSAYRARNSLGIVAITTLSSPEDCWIIFASAASFESCVLRPTWASYS